MNFFEKYRAATSVGIWFLLICITLIIWKVNETQRTEIYQQNVQETSGLVAQQLKGEIEESIGHIANLRHRLEMTDFEYYRYWDQDAERIIQTHKPFKFIEWIDSSGVIRRIEPLEGNEAAVGLDITNLDYRYGDWYQTRIDSVFNMTQWIELVQGNNAFLVDEPVFINGEFTGTITAGIDFETVFDQILSDLDDYYIHLTDELGNTFYSYGNREGTGQFQYLTVTDRIPIEDANDSFWTVTVTPNALFANTLWPMDNFIVLLLIVGLVTVLSVLFFFMLKSSSAEKEAIRNNKKFRSLINAAPIAIYVINSKGTVTDFWNQSAEQMLGWKREEVIGKFLPHVDENHKEEFREIMAHIFREQGVSSREVKRVRKDGEERIFRLHVSKLIEGEDQMLVLLEDITREKEYEIELKKNLEEKNILLAEIHHRVKNNLAIILGLIELQSEDVSDQKARSLLRKTRNRIHSISGIHEMLYQAENFSDISFEEYVNELVKRLQRSYENEDQPVEIRLQTHDLRINMNRAVPLGLLLNELITNSYKHAFKEVQDPEIVIKLASENGIVRFLYRDNGPGFDPSVLESSKSLGMTLIKSSLIQLDADYKISNNGGFELDLNFPADIGDSISPDASKVF